MYKEAVQALRDTKDMDEAPRAYKDIDIVMANQMDLAEIVVKLEPLAELKE